MLKSPDLSYARGSLKGSSYVIPPLSISRDWPNSMNILTNSSSSRLKTPQNRHSRRKQSYVGEIPTLDLYGDDAVVTRLMAYKYQIAAFYLLLFHFLCSRVWYQNEVGITQ